MIDETKADPLIVPRFNGQLVTINDVVYGIMNTSDIEPSLKQIQGGYLAVVIVLMPYEDFCYTDCHFCGTPTNEFGYESRKGELKLIEGELKMVWKYHDESLTRHWLRDCRPDLVEHEIGQLCTWPEFIEERHLHLNKPMNRPGCYAYQDSETGEWTNQHIYFYSGEALS